jgi:hypothetical protein
VNIIGKAVAASKPTAQEIFARELVEHKASSLDIRSYLCWAACEIQRERASAEGWKHTSTPVFEFAHYAKAHPELRSRSADNVRKGILNRLAGLAKAKAMTVEKLFESFFGENFEEGMTEFFMGWPRVRFPKGKKPLDLAMENNRLYPIEIDNPPTAGYANFIGVCYWLHRGLDYNQPIVLPQELLAEKLGVAQMTVFRYIEWAVEQQYLMKARRHNHAQGRATTYYFDPQAKFTQVPNGTGIRLQLDNSPLSIAVGKSVEMSGGQ